MTQDESSLAQGWCHFESASKIFVRVLGEQTFLWLVIAGLAFVMANAFGMRISCAGLLWVAVFYGITVIASVSWRYRSERAVVNAVSNENIKVLHEIEKNIVEFCKFKVKSAYCLDSDEYGPELVLEVDSDEFIVLSILLMKDKNPRQEVEIVRLPNTKKIISVSWMGENIKIKSGDLPVQPPPFIKEGEPFASGL